MMAVPVEMPVNAPDALTVTTAVFPDVQTPPDVADETYEGVPTQNTGAETLIGATSGIGLTVTTAVR